MDKPIVTPAESPEFPITVLIDGSLNPVDLAHRLARGGLALKHKDGNAVLIRSEPVTHTQDVRKDLFNAQGIVELTRFAVTSKLDGLDETAIVNALSVASRIIDDVAASLEVKS